VQRELVDESRGDILLYDACSSAEEDVAVARRLPGLIERRLDPVRPAAYPSTETANWNLKVLIGPPRRLTPFDSRA
jgi:hypothetical protein